MDKILKRDDFIKDIYNPLKEQRDYEELVKLNEGLLKNLFGKIKNMFVDDWKKINGDSSIISVYKTMDDKLTGFTTMKMFNRDKCNKIRQELVDMAAIWYEYMKDKSEKDGEEIKPASTMNFKDETLKDSLSKCQNAIKTVADGDNQMVKWAQLLMDDMKVVINQSIISEVKDEKLRKEIEEKNAEELKKQEEVNKKVEEFQKEQLEQIEKDRTKLITDTESTPVNADLLGDKAIQNLCGEFEKITKEKNPDDRKDLFQNDSYLGFKSLFKDDDFAKKEFKTTYKMLTAFYASLGESDIMNKFKQTPGQSVQAMCISVNAFIKGCIFGGNDYGEHLPLMAKCAVVSDGTLSYNLPINDKGDGNYFTDIAGIISRGEFNKDAKGKEFKLPNDFKTNATTLLNKIIDEAKKMKEDSEKAYNEAVKKFKIDDEESSLED